MKASRPTESTRSGVSRRHVLQGAAATAAGVMIVPRRVLGGRGYQAPSDTLNIASVGIGGKGTSDIAACDHENIVALCDIDFERGSRTINNFPDLPRYRDYRVMLERERNIDAVTISTPDHMHAFVALAAMQLGKHVFVQKPLTRTLEECRLLMKVAQDKGVVTQMGNQGNAGDGTRKIHEWLEAGLIGNVGRIEYWTNRPVWPQAIDRPTEAHNVPPHVDWDLWLGCAPYRPYHPDYYHPFNWRGWWDFGTGALGDIACHSMDAAFTAFDLGTPESVVAEVTRLYEETAPAASRITYEFAAKGSRGPITVIWRDGQLSPPRHPMFDGETWPPMNSGQLYVGERGLLMADIYGNRPRLFPSKLNEQVEADPPPQKYPRTEGIHRQWTEACKGNGKCGSSIPEHSGPLTEMVLLGNLALRTSEIVRWKPQQGTAGSEATDALITGTYKSGWNLAP